MAMTLIELLKRIFSTTTDEFEIAIHKREQNRNPKDQLILLKKNFEQRKEQYEKDTQEILVAKERLLYKYKTMDNKAETARAKYQRLLGLDANDKPILASEHKEYQDRHGNWKMAEKAPAEPGYRWERDCLMNWRQRPITEEDQLQAQMLIEQAEGYTAAANTLKPAFEKAKEQAEFCEKNIKKMKFISDMYESKLQVIDAQIAAANAANSMVRIGTFDLDMDKTLENIQAKVNEIQWDAKARLRIAEIKRESNPEAGLLLTGGSSKSSELLRIAMCKKD